MRGTRQPIGFRVLRVHRQLRALRLLLAIGLLSAVSLLPAQALAEGRIRLGVDTGSVYLGDVIVVDVESSGLLDPVDVSPLRQDAAFIRETRGTRIAVIGGRVVDIHLRRMELSPLTTGTLVLGPLLGEDAAGEVRSNSVSVTVQPPLQSAWQPGEDALEMLMQVSRADPRVGEQVVLDITLRHRFAIADERIVLPAMQGFEVVPLLQGRRTTDPDDPDRRRIQWRYLLHAEQAGTLTIEGTRWSGTLVGSRTRRGDFEREAPPIVLQVRPLPAAYNPGTSTDSGSGSGSGSGTANWWLPARAVTLSESWSEPVVELDAGDEVVRTITLRADGSLAEYLPAIGIPETRGLTITPLTSARETVTGDSGSTATAVFTYRVTAESPVPVFLDTVRIAWWDTTSDSARESILPARRINVGLPDDADVLVERALAGDWQRRIAYHLSVLGTWHRLLYGVAVLAVLAAGVLWYRWYGQVVLTGLHARWRRRRWQRRLERAARRRDWVRVETLLNDAPLFDTPGNDSAAHGRARYAALRLQAQRARYAR